MLEDYGILMRVDRGEPTGEYFINRRGNKKEVLKYVERYETKIGEFLPEVWREKALEEIKAAGKMELLEKVKEHCKTHCLWLKKDAEQEDHAISCVCSGAYKHWKDFGYKEGF